jgi:hypothetical protein
MAGRYVGFGKKLFDLALGKGKSNVSTTITGVTPNVGTLKEFQKHKDDIIKMTNKHSKGLTDEGKIKIKGNVSSALSKLSKITKKKPVEKAKGGRVGLKRGTFPDLSGDGQITKEDILIGRGVLKKKKKKTMMAKSKTPMDKAVRKDKKKKRFV